MNPEKAFKKVESGKEKVKFYYSGQALTQVRQIDGKVFWLKTEA